MHLLRLTLAVCLLSGSLFADTPEQAILETVFAKDAKTVLKHLPPAIAEILRAFPEKERKEAYSRLLPERWMGGKPMRSDDGRDLWRYEYQHPHLGAGQRPIVSVRLKRQLSNGVEAMLQLVSCQEECYGGVQIWMRHEEGEWRFLEIQAQGHKVIDFDDADFLANFRSSIEYDGNEPQAIANLRMLNTALVTYLSTYEVFPQSLKSLSGTHEDDSEPTAQGAMLIEEEFMAEPCIVGGYLFEYRWMSVEDGEGYELTARPVAYGKSGRRSFYADQTGVIRGTKDDRAATREDKAL